MDRQAFIGCFAGGLVATPLSAPAQQPAKPTIGYAADLNDIWRRAAFFADKILKSEQPADLFVEQRTKFRLVINWKTAKAPGLTIPQALRLRADEVIQ